MIVAARVALFDIYHGMSCSDDCPRTGAELPANRRPKAPQAVAIKQRRVFVTTPLLSVESLSGSAGVPVVGLPAPGLFRTLLIHLHPRLLDE